MRESASSARRARSGPSARLVSSDIRPAPCNCRPPQRPRSRQIAREHPRQNRGHPRLACATRQRSIATVHCCQAHGIRAHRRADLQPDPRAIPELGGRGLDQTRRVDLDAERARVPARSAQTSAGPAPDTRYAASRILRIAADTDMAWRGARRRARRSARSHRCCSRAAPIESRPRGDRPAPRRAPSPSCRPMPHAIWPKRHRGDFDFWHRCVAGDRAMSVGRETI